jgi:hypothetical protein
VSVIADIKLPRPHIGSVNAWLLKGDPLTPTGHGRSVAGPRGLLIDAGVIAERLGDDGQARFELEPAIPR